MLSCIFERIFNIDGNIIIICLAFLTALYLIFGGYFATSLSDFVQGIIMIVGVIVMVVLFLTNSNVNGAEGLKALSNDGYGLFVGYGNVGFLDSPLVMLISLILLTSMGVYGLPQTVHKYYTVRDSKAIKQGMIVSTIFAFLVGVIAYFVGGLAHLFLEPDTYANVLNSNTDNIIPYMLDKVIPVGLLGLIGVLVLSASMSTLASVSLSSASTLTLDLYKTVAEKNGKKLDEKKTTLVMRIMCFLFILLSVVIAILNKKYNITAIAFMMGLSWGTLSGCFFGPFVLGLYNKKLTKTSAYVSIIGGLVFTAIFTVVFGVIKSGAGASFGDILKNGVAMSPLTGVLCMIFSCIVVIAVSICTKPLDNKIIENAFDKKIENEIK